MTRLIVHVEGETEERLRQRSAGTTSVRSWFLEGRRTTNGKRSPTVPARRYPGVDHVCEKGHLKSV